MAVFKKWEEEIWPPKKNPWLKSSLKSSLIRTIYKTQTMETKAGSETQASTVKETNSKRIASKEETRKWLRSLVQKMPKANYYSFDGENESETEK